MGKGGGGGGKTYDYYGTIAGAVCAGPVDELVAIVMDGKAVWPTATAWKTGTAYAVGNLVSDLGVVYKCVVAHTASASNKPPGAAGNTWWTRYTITRSGSPNPLPITVEGFGPAYFYWGTSTQTLDTTGEKTMAAKGHPPYRRQAFIVLKDYLFGRERTSAPNLEVIVRKAPNQSIVTGSPATLSDGQANAIAAMADLYTDPVFGAGLVADTPGAPDTTTWQSTANALDGSASQAAISPVLTRALTLRQFTAELLAYVDGWARFNSLGEIEAGRFPHNAAPPSFTAATTIDFHDLIDEVSYTADGWEQTINQAQVKFTDRERGFKDGAVSYVSGYNLAVTGESRTKRIDRPWITRRQQATDHAAEWGKIMAEPKVAGSLVVRAEKADSIRPGDLFQLTHDALAVSIVCRCISKDIAAPPAGRVTIRFESDRAASAIPYQPSAPADPGATWPDIETLSLRQFIQPPPAMIQSGTDANLVPLIARTKAVTIGAVAWIRSADTALFYELGKVDQFAIYGTVQAAYNPTTTYATTNRARASNVATITTAATHGLTVGMTVAISGLGGTGYNGTFVVASVPSGTTFTYANTGANEATTSDTLGTVDPGDDDVTETFRVTMNANTVAADLAKMLQTQTEDAIANNEVVVVVLDQTNQKYFEVMTLRSMRIVGTDTFYRLKVRRGRFNTIKRTNGVGDFVFIAYRSDLVGLRSQAITDALTNLSTVTMRLQAQDAIRFADLANATQCPDISYTFNDPYAPKVGFNSVTADGVEITDFTVVRPLTTVFGLQATIQDDSADLTDAWLFARLGARDVLLWSGKYAPSKIQNTQVSFTLPSKGEWTVYMGAMDASNRVRYYQLTQGGVPSNYVTLKAGYTAATECSPPTLSPWSPLGYSSTGGTITLACSTAGATIKYYVGNLGDAQPGTGSFLTYTAPFTLGWYTGKTVYAYATKAGLTDSIMMRYDFVYVPRTNSDTVPPGYQIP